MGTVLDIVGRPIALGCNVVPLIEKHVEGLEHERLVFFCCGLHHVVLYLRVFGPRRVPVPSSRCSPQRRRRKRSPTGSSVSGAPGFGWSARSGSFGQMCVEGFTAGGLA